MEPREVEQVVLWGLVVLAKPVSLCSPLASLSRTACSLCFVSTVIPGSEYAVCVQALCLKNVFSIHHTAAVFLSVC